MSFVWTLYPSNTVVCVCSQGEFDVQAQLPNVVPDPASLELGSEYFCEQGKVVFGDQCGKYEYLDLTTYSPALSRTNFYSNCIYLISMATDIATEAS